MSSAAISIAILGAFVGVAVFYATRGLTASLNDYFRAKFPHQEMQGIGPFVGWDAAKVVRVRVFLDRYVAPVSYGLAFALLFLMFQWGSQ